jgi:hypothetical protein
VMPPILNMGPPFSESATMTRKELGLLLTLGLVTGIAAVLIASYSPLRCELRKPLIIRFEQWPNCNTPNNSISRAGLALACTQLPWRI